MHEPQSANAARTHCPLRNRLRLAELLEPGADDGLAVWPAVPGSRAVRERTTELEPWLALCEARAQRT